MKRRGRLLPALLLIALLAAGWFVFGGWYGRGPLKHATDFAVAQGATLPVVAVELQKSGVLGSARAFRLRARLFHHGAPIKAGEFLLPPAASESEIFAILTGDMAVRRLRDSEIVELITHLAFYAGWPAAMNAVQTARQTLEKAS